MYMFTHTICVVYIAIHDIHKEPTLRFKALNNTERTMSRERLSLKENRENHVERKTSLKENRENYVEIKTVIKGEQRELCRDKDCH